MILKDVFEVETIDDKKYMICMDSSVLAGMVELNETAAFIVECLKEETTIEQIAVKMAEIYSISSEEAIAGVSHIVKQLQGIGAISE